MNPQSASAWGHVSVGLILERKVYGAHVTYVTDYPAPH
jgi:hypothetical protein